MSINETIPKHFASGLIIISDPLLLEVNVLFYRPAYFSPKSALPL